jgi:hypothetical protein
MPDKTAGLPFWTALALAVGRGPRMARVTMTLAAGEPALRIQ